MCKWIPPHWAICHHDSPGILTTDENVWIATGGGFIAVRIPCMPKQKFTGSCRIGKVHQILNGCHLPPPPLPPKNNEFHSLAFQIWKSFRGSKNVKNNFKKYFGLDHFIPTFWWTLNIKNPLRNKHFTSKFCDTILGMIGFQVQWIEYSYPSSTFPWNSDWQKWSVQ